uniref:Uncharacterized protein n=1 Tax=Panagrolaimus sp. PS1159 TaxID=55785 RepID=A0AC35GQS6_9BILA
MKKPPTCVMVKGDIVTNLVNENYELMKNLQKEGRKPELFDMEKFLCNHDDLSIFFYDPATQNSHHELQQEQLSNASDAAELSRVYPDAPYQSYPYEEYLGHSTPIHDVTLEPRVDEINNNFDAQQAVQEPEVQPPRNEVRFAPTQQPPTCVMVKGDIVTKIYEYEFLPYKEVVQIRPPYSQIEAYDNGVQN